MGFQGNDIAGRLAIPPKDLIITHVLFPPCQSRLVAGSFVPRVSAQIQSAPKRIGGCRKGGPTTSTDRLFGGRTFSGGEVSLRAPESVALTWVVIRKFGRHAMTRSRRITKTVGNDRLRSRPGAVGGHAEEILGRGRREKHAVHGLSPAMAGARAHHSGRCRIALVGGALDLGRVISG